MSDIRSRKWQLTINNPDEHGLSREVILDKISTLKSVIYYCLCNEIGEEGTPHVHVYLQGNNAIRFSTLQLLFDKKAHLEVANGSAQQNRDYIRKEGKHSSKSCTNLIDTFFESGEVPVEQQGKRSDLVILYDMINSGMSDYEIFDENPNYISKIDIINKVRQTLNSERFKHEFRKLDVTYIWGEPGTGKTRYVMETHGFENVYRVTNYKHPFDTYNGQDVLLFDEFRSSLPIVDMLNYLDGYPLMLPARYGDRVACFTKVYLVSNIAFKSQFPNIQISEPLTFQAFERRINNFLYRSHFGFTGSIDY